MTKTKDPKRQRIIPCLLLGGGAAYALTVAGPLLNGTQINPMAAGAWIALIGCGAAVLTDTLRTLADLFDRQAALTPTGLKGTSGWVKSLSEIKHDLIAEDWGPYWGAFKGREVMADFASNALTLGPAGSGKDTRVKQNTILCIRESKVVIDFKGSSTCVLANALRERGEIVRVFNIGDVWSDIIGPSDTYNPLCMIADNYWRPGGLRDVSDDVHEMGLQIYPEPQGGGQAQNDNSYFRDGSRDLIGFAIQTCIMIDGDKATLGDVLDLLKNRQKLLQYARWACGKLVVVPKSNQGEASDPSQEDGS